MNDQFIRTAKVGYLASEIHDLSILAFHVSVCGCRRPSMAKTMSPVRHATRFCTCRILRQITDNRSANDGAGKLCRWPCCQYIVMLQWSRRWWMTCLWFRFTFKRMPSSSALYFWLEAENLIGELADRSGLFISQAFGSFLHGADHRRWTTH